MADTLKTTMKGGAVTLYGPVPSVGEKAPDAVVSGNDLGPVKLSDYTGKYILLSVVPSLDTGVCDAQTRRFNEEAARFSDDTVILTISMDLPFAQARWCGAAGVDQVITLSDYKDADFGQNFGLLIKELRLLNRAVFVIDKDSTIIYRDVLKENTDHPDYDAALKALQALAG